MTQPVTTVRPPGPRFGISLVVLLAGLGAAIVGVVMLVSAFWSIIDGPVYTVPGNLRVHLGSGDYKIYEYERFGSADGFRTAPPLVDSATVRVVSPGGTRIPVTSTAGGSSETISNGNGSYTAVVRFTAPSTGTYTIQVRTAAPTRIRIEHPLVDIAGDNVGWILLIVAGGITTLVGFVLVIVGLVRRGSAKRRANALPAVAAPVAAAPAAWPPTPAPGTVPPPGATAPTPAAPTPAAPVPAPPTVAPAGWYPDPSGGHRVRYWDGQTWTEHIAD